MFSTLIALLEYLIALFEYIDPVPRKKLSMLNGHFLADLYNSINVHVLVCKHKVVWPWPYQPLL